MAAHSNRSPSPLSSRPTSLNPRNSENIGATRKSFSGNNAFSKPSALANPRRFDPNTPANSPADYARRRSVSKDCDEKENEEKDNILRASKLQSPAKGSKNFMSPTISAASKFTPSPRKKVLVERNDPVRTSISLSEGKAVFFSTTSSNISEDLDSKSELAHNQNLKSEISLKSNVGELGKTKAFQEDPPVPKLSRRVSFSDADCKPVTELSESVVTDVDSDSSKMDSSVKNNNISCSSPSPSIAPLDADPSLPPYDPKTNYLSPRPQFLHYKPNPRIEVLLKKENGLDSDEYTEAVSLSESECTEESQTEEDSNKDEFEVTAPEDMVIGVDETVEAPHGSEPCESLPVSTSVTTAIPEENIVQKNEKKPRGFSKVMCFSVLMMFFVACASISVTYYSPSLDELAVKDLSLSDLKNWYNQSKVAAAAKEHFDLLARHVNELSANSVSFISSLAIDLGIGEKVGQLQYMNISYKVNKEPGEDNLEEEEELEEEDQDTQVDTFEEEEYAEVDYEVTFEKKSDTQDEEEVLESEQVSSDSLELERDDVISSINTPQCSEMKTEDLETDLVEAAIEDASTNVDTKLGPLYQLVATPKDYESELEAVVEDATTTIDTNLGSSSEADITPLDKSSALLAIEDATTNVGASAGADITPLDQNSPSSDDSQSEVGLQSSVMLETPPSQDKFLAHHVMGVSSLIAALLAGVAFVYRYKRNHSSANSVQVNPLPSAFNGTKHVHKEKQLSQNWATEEDEIGESSCPSEMSSYQKSTSYSRKELRGASEVQSIERNTRKFSKRESLASSSTEISMASASYGSFTTFERIPIKNAIGEEEIITPVRRSSRIRNHQVMSP